MRLKWVLKAKPDELLLALQNSYILSGSTVLCSHGGGVVPRQPVQWPSPPQTLQCLHLRVWRGAGPGQILWGQCSGPRRHGLLDGCFLAVGFEERC